MLRTYQSASASSLVGYRVSVGLLDLRLGHTMKSRTWYEKSSNICLDVLRASRLCRNVGFGAFNEELELTKVESNSWLLASYLELPTGPELQVQRTWSGTWPH